MLKQHRDNGQSALLRKNSLDLHDAGHHPPGDCSPYLVPIKVKKIKASWQIILRAFDKLVHNNEQKKPGPSSV